MKVTDTFDLVTLLPAVKEASVRIKVSLMETIEVDSEASFFANTRIST